MKSTQRYMQKGTEERKVDRERWQAVSAVHTNEVETEVYFLTSCLNYAQTRKTYFPISQPITKTSIWKHTVQGQTLMPARWNSSKLITGCKLYSMWSPDMTKEQPARTTKKKSYFLTNICALIVELRDIWCQSALCDHLAQRWVTFMYIPK